MNYIYCMGCLCASFTEGGERDNERVSLHYAKEEVKQKALIGQPSVMRAFFWNFVWVKLIQDLRRGGELAIFKLQSIPSNVDAYFGEPRNYLHDRIKKAPQSVLISYQQNVPLLLINPISVVFFLSGTLARRQVALLENCVYPTSPGLKTCDKQTLFEDEASIFSLF